MSAPRFALVAALFAAGLPVPAQAQDLAGGSYACSSGGQDFGRIEIDGGRYRAAGGGWTSYRRVGPAILWEGTLGPISAAGEVVGSTVTGGGFDVQIKSKTGGQFQLVRCRA